MLIGEYTHALDDKKRLSIPSKFRSELGKQVVVTRGLDQCLFVYALAAWQDVTKKIAALSFGSAHAREFSRFMLSGAVECDIDSSGRVLIPDYLKSFADLGDKGDKVVITGVHNRVEVWNRERWDAYKERIQIEADILAEKLGEIGAI